MQTLTSLCSLRPDFGRNADWLLEQCHKIWLAVGINGSWKRLFLGRFRDPPSAERRIDFAVFFIVLWSYGRKICLNMCHGNSENLDGCSYLLRICFIYRTNVSVSRCWIHLWAVDREQGVFWLTNKRVQNTEFSRWLRFVIFYFQSYGSALFTVSKCNSCSISSFSIFPLPAGHTWQRNTEEKSWRGVKTNTKGSAYFQEKGWQLWKMWVF